MSLVPDYEDSSSESFTESDDDDDAASTNRGGEDEIGAADKLPTPGFISSKMSESQLTTSVFANPFLEAENAKRAVLEKHVKMVSANDAGDFLNGKKICWNYRKGRCRFGHNCKFAHDSDLQKSREQIDADNRIQETVICQSQHLPQPTANESCDVVQEKNVKRKRPGLSQGLVPGKKVMKSYFNLKK